MTHAPARHRATHRAPRPPRRRPSGRALAAAAVGGVMLTGGAVGAQAVVGGSSDRADASAEPALASTADEGVSRSAARPSLLALDQPAQNAADQARKTAEDEADKIAKQKKKDAAEKKAQEALDNARQDPKGAAKTLLAERGWSDQFSCLDSLWSGESGWNYQATNASSGAYGIPQSLPADKMATAGADWKTNPVTQITWGLDYIDRTYGTPCSAQGFKSGHGWY